LPSKGSNILPTIPTLEDPRQRPKATPVEAGSSLRDGYPEARDYTWEPYEHLHDSARAHQLLVQFHQENPEKLRHPELKKDDEDVEMEG
jgi:hypothetical protein